MRNGGGIGGYGTHALTCSFAVSAGRRNAFGFPDTEEVQVQIL